MTRIEWLLKGDPLYSLQVARRIGQVALRSEQVTSWSTSPTLSFPEATNAEVTWSDRLKQMFSFGAKGYGDLPTGIRPPVIP